MKLFSFILGSILFLASCSTEEKMEDVGDLKIGKWRAGISLNDSIQTNFILTIQKSGTDTIISLNNANEIIYLDLKHAKDSLILEVPVFPNYLIFKSVDDRLTGYFVNPDADNYRLPFSAQFGDSLRYPTNTDAEVDISGNWATMFKVNSPKPSKAIGYFNQDGNRLYSTFMTETGDYRFIEGSLNATSLEMSAFDGSHLYYFKAEVKGDTIYGDFYSGRSYHTNWKSFKSDEVKLRNPNELTYIKREYDGFDFKFPMLNGDSVSLSDDRFKDKAVIVQIMGSWCPNCMDETRYLNVVYDDYHNDGLEIVGLSFERVKSKEIAEKRVEKMIKDLKIQYPILMAGYTREDKAEEALPMLNHIMSFPTSIYLDKDHNVVKIHTGFNGQGTPSFDKFIIENDSTIKTMIGIQ